MAADHEPAGPGPSTGNLNSRRGQILGHDLRGNANVINALVPLANMFGCVNDLRSISQGRATFDMQFDHYEEVPSACSGEVDAGSPTRTYRLGDDPPFRPAIGMRG